MSCSVCEGDICEHGICSDNWCGGDGPCPDCYRRRQLELDADREAAWQHNVIGPLLGLSDED